MIKRIGIATVCLFVAAGIFIKTPGGAAAQAVPAKAVAEHMDKSKYSSAEIKSYLKDLKGKEITADGKIDEILTGKSGTRVVVFVNIPGRSRDFIVDVYVNDAKDFRKGDGVSCKGEYTKYNMFTLNGIAIKGSCSK